MKLIILLIFLIHAQYAQTIMQYPNALSIQTDQNKIKNNNMIKVPISVKIQNNQVNEIIILLTKLFPNSIFLKDPTQNNLIIKSTKDMLPYIKKTIKKLNNKESLIELSIQIYEVSSQSNSTKQGLLEPFQTGIKYNQATNTILPTEKIFNIMKQLKSAGNASLKANPILKTKNKESALFKVGDLIPYLTITSTATAEYTSLNQLETGINLNLKPEIISPTEISCSINFDMAMIKVWKTLESSEYPILSFRKVNNVVTIKNNESLVIAGLIDEFKKNNKNTIPILNKIPFLKKVFSSKNEENLKSDVYIIITPKILN